MRYRCCNDRRLLLALASRITRDVFVDRERARYAAKRGAGASTLELQEESERQSQIRPHRYFGCLIVGENARAVDLAPTELRFARAWLAAEPRPEATV